MSESQIGHWQTSAKLDWREMAKHFKVRQHLLQVMILRRKYKMLAFTYFILKDIVIYVYRHIYTCQNAVQAIWFYTRIG